MSEINKRQKLTLDNYILLYDYQEFFFPHYKNKKIRIYQIYKKSGLLYTYLLKLLNKFKILPSLVYNDLKTQISVDDTIILFSTVPDHLFRYVQRTFPNNRIIFWYWNPILPKNQINNFISSKVEVWTFDLQDSLKYNINHNTQFYFNTIKLNTTIQVIYDVVFVGLDKGRSGQLSIFEKNLRELNLRPFIYIADNSENSTKKTINYDEYLNLVASSRAILDMLQPNQSGLTLRPLEALFFNKKLISNNQELLNERFYNKNNIFILGYDDLSSLPMFLDAPFQSIDQSIIDEFDVASWLIGFDKK